MKTRSKILFVLITFTLLSGISPSISSGINILGKTGQHNVVFIDDDLNPSTSEIGYNHFENIQYEIANALADDLPTIKITNPKPGYLYFNFLDIITFQLPFIVTLIIGKNDVETDVTQGAYAIDRVEFYIDDDLKFTDYNAPYKWVWNEQTPFFYYTIKAVVYDVHGFQTSDVIKVYKLHYLVSY